MVNRLTHDKWMNGENNTTPTSGGNWKWGPVREINMFFDNYSKCTSPFSAYEQTYGEACFLRALVYHGLVANLVTYLGIHLNLILRTRICIRPVTSVR